MAEINIISNTTKVSQEQAKNSLSNLYNDTKDMPKGDVPSFAEQIDYIHHYNPNSTVTIVIADPPQGSPEESSNLFTPLTPNEAGGYDYVITLYESSFDGNAYLNNAAPNHEVLKSLERTAAHEIKHVYDKLKKGSTSEQSAIDSEDANMNHVDPINNPAHARTNEDRYEIPRDNELPNILNDDAPEGGQNPWERSAKPVSNDLWDIVRELWDSMIAVLPNRGDPLVLDLNNNGISLTGMTSSHAYFNLEDRGFATINGWVTGGDGLLCQDSNSNGIVDDIGELFGSATQTGFEELSTLDSNFDSKITSADSAWSTLRVFVDADEDGVTDDGELKTLADLNITEIGLTTTQSNTEIDGNILVETANFVMNGANHTVGEVLFEGGQ